MPNENGPILGKFISDYKTECPEDKIRIIAHSLRSRVTLSALQWIHDNINEQNDNNTSKGITSVHLMGAAVNNDQSQQTQMIVFLICLIYPVLEMLFNPK